MAFYQNAPGKRKTKVSYADLGSWEEEGSHYRKPREEPAERGQRKNGGDAAGRPASRRPRQEHSRPSEGRFRPVRNGGISRGSSSEDRRYREEPVPGTRAPGRPASRHEAPDGRNPSDYRDYEFRPAIPPEDRAEDQSYILSGRNPIREALRGGRDIEKLLVQKGDLSASARDIVQMARAAKVMVQEVDRNRLDEITPHHQGLIAFASAYRYAEVEDMLQEAENRGEPPFLVLLDSVTDPHNLGAIIRTAECVGAHGVIVPQHRSVGLTPAAVKASAGAIEHIPVARVTNLNRTIEELRTKGIWVYAVTMNGEDYEKVDFRGGTALVIGAEGEGISRLTLEKCDQAVSLPMRGKLDSLNASVAAGVILYRVLSCRRS